MKGTKNKDVYFQKEMKKILGLSTGKDGFCSSDIKHARGTEQRTKLFRPTGCKKLSHDPENSPGFECR
jgi:hypothetical protein